MNTVTDINQREIIQKARRFVIEQEGKFTFENALYCFENLNIDQEEKFAIGWALLTMLQKHKQEYDAIEQGLTKKMQGSIINKMY